MPCTQFGATILAFSLFFVCATSIQRTCCAQGAAREAETTSGRPSITAVRVGFDGKYKVGSWTPVWVTVAGGKTEVELDVQLLASDADGVPARYAGEGTKIRLSAGEELALARYVKFGRLKSALTVELHGNEGLLASRTFAISELPAAQPSTAELFVSVGGNIGVAEALQLRRGKSDEPVATPLLRTAADLPDRWWGYEGVDAVCWAGSDPSLIAVSSDQFSALETWIALGGRLVLCVGNHGETLLAPGGRFARFNPGRFVEVIEQRRSVDLERYAGASQPLVRRDSAPLKMSALADLRFREEAAEGIGAARYPTIVRSSFGLGEVVLATIDLDQPPVADWPARPRLVARLLGISTDSRDDAPSEKQLGQVTHVGFEDLGGQLHSALDQFSGVPLFSFSWVAALLILYMLLIGPADYFFLRRVAKRMELTWITLPLVALLFCAAAVFLAHAWKGNQRRLNQVDIVDVDIASGVARGASLAHVYTPQTDEFDLACEIDAPFDCAAPQSLLSWHGLAGKGLGGMDGVPTAGLFQRPYSILGRTKEDAAALARLEGLPVQVSATKNLVARWWTTASLSATGSLSFDADGRLQGEITNPLKVDLLDGVLFYESSAYKLRSKLAAGERLVLSSQSPAVHIERRLTQRRIVASGETKAAWDPQSYEMPRILEIMMFHEAAGGRSYTGLTNRQEPNLDLSARLKTGRAILMARAEPPACRLTRNGAPLAERATNHYTFYRLVYPVSKRGKNEATR